MLRWINDGQLKKKTDSSQVTNKCTVKSIDLKQIIKNLKINEKKFLVSVHVWYAVSIKNISSNCI